ncbi:MAG: hypothetical protein V4635_17945 [Bacteroidota bacterium]
MKQVLTLLLLISGFTSFSQSVPQKINYQGVVRSSNGNPIVNKPVGLKFRILQGSTVASVETINVTTNALGLFNTEIGSGSGSTLSGINWANGPYTLEVSVDTLGGTNYVTLNPQQLASVPYALYAQSAGSAPSPAVSFNSVTNVLTVGSNTTLIPSGNTQSTTIVTSGAITAAQAGNTYNVFTPSVVVSAATSPTNNLQTLGLAQVLGSFPNYTVMVAPVISYSPSVGTLSLASIPFTSPSYNYTYNITPELNLNGNVLTVGPPSNSVNIPTTGTTPITTINIGAGGIGTISNPSTNNFSITIPQTSLTGAGVTGSFPNYTISGGAASVVTGSGSALPVVSVNSNTYNISVPAVSLTTSGALTTGGVYPNLTLNSPSVTVVDNPAVGFAHVAGAFPNYTVTVAPAFNYNPSTGSLVVSNTFSPALSYSFNVTPTLAYNAGTLTSGPGTNSVFIPSAAPPGIIGTGAATVITLANNFTVAVPVPSIVPTGGAGITGAYPSFTVNAPQQLNLSTAGGASQSGSYPNITVSAPAQFNLGTAGGATQSGTYPNITVSAPAQFNLGTAGGATQSGTYPNITVSAPAQMNLTGSSGAVVSGTYPNINVNAPAQLNLTTGGGASQSGTYPNITVSAPAQFNLSTSGGATQSGTYPNITVSAPAQVNLSASGGASVSGTYPNMTVSAPQQLTITTAGATTLGGTYPNLNIGTPSVSVLPYNGVLAPGTNGGLLSVFGSYPTYSLSVIPQISYSSATGSLTLTNPTTLNSWGYNITPSLSKTNNVIQSGPSTNTVAIISPAAQAFAANSLALTVFSTGTQLTSSYAFTKQSASSEIEVFAHCYVSPGTFVIASEISFELRVDGVASTISVPHYIFNGTATYITLKAYFSGITAGAHTVSIWSKTNAGTSLLVQLDPGSRGGNIILKEIY